MERNSVKECYVCGSLHAYSDPSLKIIDGDTALEQWKSVRVLMQVFKLNLRECLTFLLEERKLSNCFCQPCAILVNETVEKAEELEKVQKGFQALQAQLYQKAKFSISIHPHGSSGPKTKLGLKLIGEGGDVSMATATATTPNTANCGVSDKREGDPSISTNFTGEEGEPVKSDEHVGNNETIETVPAPPPADDKNTEGTNESDLNDSNSQDENSINDTSQENDDEMGDRGNAENDDLMDNVGNIEDDNEEGEGRTNNLNHDERRDDDHNEEEEDASSPPSCDDDDDEDYHPPSSPSPSYSYFTTAASPLNCLIDFPVGEHGQEVQRNLQSGEREIPNNYHNYGNNSMVPEVKFDWPFPCLLCNVLYLNARELGNHYKNDHPDCPWMCMECGAQLASRNGLMKHRKNLHNFPHSIMAGCQPFACEEDVKPYATPRMPQLSPQLPPPLPPPTPPCYSRQFEATVNLNHTQFSEKRDEFPFSCPQCPRNYRNAEDLKQHEHKDHQGTQGSRSSETWKCRYCSRSYRIRESLRYHRRRKHPDTFKQRKKRKATNKYGCDLCNITFPDSMKSSYHDKFVHPNLTEWKCRVCHQQFSKKRRLRRHMNDKHKDLRRKNYHVDGSLQGQNLYPAQSNINIPNVVEEQ